jgi:Tfp pilus assembly protein PilX
MMRERQMRLWTGGERGVSLITVMMVILIMTLMGISILAVTGFERQIAGSVTASEASTDAAESCVSTGANVIQQSMQAHVVPAALLSNAVPPGPVPLANLAVLNGEMINDGGNPDVPIGAGSAPNLVMTIGNYQVFGDIDRMYIQCAFGSDCTTGSPTARHDIFYQITCVAQNLATGITSQVGAMYVCNNPGAFCQPRPY